MGHFLYIKNGLDPPPLPPSDTSLQVCVAEVRARLQQEEAQLRTQIERLLSSAQKKKFSLFPVYWHPRDHPGDTQVVDVTETLRGPMQELMDGTCNTAMLGKGKDQKQPGAYSELKVRRVDRVQNVGLWLKYRLQYQELLKHRHRPTETQLDPSRPETQPRPVATLRHGLTKEHQLDHAVNECYLFHGTTAETSKKIIANGFEERLAQLTGMYGAGAYFAEESSKSDQYTMAQDGVHFMFVARVLLGAQVFETSKSCSQRRILDEVPGLPGVRYSSLLGLHGKLREFVVYDGQQAYPEFLVHYERRR